jgi:ribosome maturation protein SDO1|eukprot:253931_1
MSRQITQPVNQVRLTNVAVVRMNTHGKRFEVACYRNKILNYRQKIETDLSEVLQTDRVFTNVSKGLFAPRKDMLKAFNSTDQEEVCRIILDKGQIQVSDMERSATLENTAKEIANYISTKCVHPLSNRPYTTNQIRDAMKKAEISVQPTSARSVKQQFLDCVRIIQEKKVLDIQRAKMELAIVLPNPDGELVDLVVTLLKEEANALIENVIEDQRVHFLIDPSQYRIVDNISKEQQGSKLEILRQTVRQEGDVDVSLELERNILLQQSRNDNNTRAGTPSLESVQELPAQSTLAHGLDKLDLKYNDDDDDYEAIANTRKKNKKAAKKSKKAKRREKEESAIRKQRIDTERNRQEERQFRLGLNSDGKKPEKVEADDANDGPRRSCNTCGGSFTPAEYRAHFKSDWHRYNVKLKMKNIPPVSEQEFLLIDSGAFFADDML